MWIPRDPFPSGRGSDGRSCFFPVLSHSCPLIQSHVRSASQGHRADAQSCGVRGWGLSRGGAGEWHPEWLPQAQDWLPAGQASGGGSVGAGLEEGETPGGTENAQGQVLGPRGHCRRLAWPLTSSVPNLVARVRDTEGP